MSAPVKTRFAPSPTGYLHIGGARTALFNWALARHLGGEFLLRIEDTDRARSTPDAVDAILDGLKWLGLQWDGDAVSQFSNANRHAQIARQLLDEGKAYYCYSSPEELEAMREAAKREGRPAMYDRSWRDRDASEAPEGRDPVIRIKAPLQGEIALHDEVQGDIKIDAQSLDDFVILRADGTPTYMLAVVVDDYDMGITHVVRGDDHLNNAVRQTVIYQALEWASPTWAHIPLIHGADGAKLSKRHGALGVLEYKDMGYLPEGLLNYLARLGWSHGDDEIFGLEQFVNWFGLEAINKGASRLDFAKLDHVNGHHLQQMSNATLYEMLLDFAPFEQNKPTYDHFTNNKSTYLDALEHAKSRASNLVQLVEQLAYVSAQRPVTQDEQTLQKLNDEALGFLSELLVQFNQLSDWQAETIKSVIKDFTKQKGVKMGAVAQPIRAALCGIYPSGSLFDIMQILGKDTCLARLEDAQNLSG